MHKTYDNFIVVSTLITFHMITFSVAALTATNLAFGSRFSNIEYLQIATDFDFCLLQPFAFFSL